MTNRERQIKCNNCKGYMYKDRNLYTALPIWKCLNCNHEEPRQVRQSVKNKKLNKLIDKLSKQGG